MGEHSIFISDKSWHNQRMQIRVPLAQSWRLAKIGFGRFGQIEALRDNSFRTFWTTIIIQYSMALSDSCKLYCQTVV